MPKLLPWKTIKTKKIYTDDPHISLLSDDIALPDGRIVEGYYRIDSRPSCAIVATDSQGRFIMLRQYKHGAGKVCLTFPGGRLEPNETIAQTAVRELREETGYEAVGWRCIGDFPIHANQHVGVVSIFKANNAMLVAAPNADDLEEMEVVLIKSSDVRAALEAGEIALLGDVAAFSLAALID